MAVIVFILMSVVFIFSLSGSSYLQRQTETAESFIFSKAISSITASGNVAAINGQYITLDKSGDSIKILVPEKKPVYILAEGSGSQKKVSFSDIKVGDGVNINLKAAFGKELEGQAVIIFSSAK